MVRLLALPRLVHEDLEEGRLTTGHARALLAVPEPDRQLGLRNLVVERRLSVRATEALVNRERRSPAAPGATAGHAPSGAAAPATAPATGQALQFQAVQEMLEKRLATRVTIHPAGQGTDPGGRIEIEFYSLDEFNRLYELLVR